MTLEAEEPTRREPPIFGDERTMLTGWLDFHRETLAMKASRLSADDLARRPVATSAMSLLGLVRHLTEIERTYFGQVFGGQDLPLLPFGDDPFGEGPDDDFAVAASPSPDDALAMWRAEVARARAVIAAAPSLDDVGHSELPLRFWLVKTLNEYARHNGHADLLRELIDGVTGE